MTELRAGRELDALVAIALKWEPTEYDWLAIAKEPGSIGHSKLPHFSTEIGAAWEVVAQMEQNFRLLTISREMAFDREPWWDAFFHSINAAMHDSSASAETAPLAICLAALKAVGLDTQEVTR